MPWRRLGERFRRLGHPIGYGYGGGVKASAPLAAMGWREYWPVLDNTFSFSDAGTTPCVNNDPCQQFNGSLGVVANSQFSQAVLGNRPLFKTGGANGKSFLAFDGTGDLMASLNTSNFLSMGSYTMLIALTVSTGFTSAAALVDDTAIWFDISPILAGSLLRLRHWDVAYKEKSVAITLDVPHVVAYKYDGVGLYVTIDGVSWSVATPAGNLGGNGVLRLGGAGTGDLNLYAFAMSNVVVDDANLLLNMNYLKDQLGIT